MTLTETFIPKNRELSASFYASERNPIQPNPTMATPMTSNGKEIGINKPTPFTGDRTKIGTFIQESKVYLTINKNVYDKDETKIAFMLSYMTDKEALQWKELYLEQITDNNGDLVFPTFKQFLDDLKDSFKPADRTGDAMNKLNNLKQGNKTAEELSTEFRLLAGQAGLEAKSHSDHIHLIGLFRNALRPSLSRRILFGEIVPKTIEEWIAKAIQYDTNYRMAIALTGQANRMTGSAYRNKWASRTTETKDPNAMDIDSMTIEERNNLMKQGACFKCKKRGHMAKDCPEKKSTPTPSKKFSAKDLYTQIRTMTKEEKDDFVKLMMDETDETGF